MDAEEEVEEEEEEEVEAEEDSVSSGLRAGGALAHCGQVKLIWRTSCTTENGVKPRSCPFRGAPAQPLSRSEIRFSYEEPSCGASGGRGWGSHSS